MLNRHVLAALAAGIPANDEDAARVALKGVDPVARGFARRKLERSLIDAALACDAAQLQTPPPAHVMKLAALTVAGRAADAADQPGVSTAYASLPAPTMPRFPLWTLVTLLVTASLVGGVAFYIATRPGPPPRSYARKLPPPSADAFKVGGTPLHDPAIDKLLKEELTDLVVQLNRAGDNDRELILKKARTPEPILAKSKELAKAWDAMLAALDKSVHVAQNGGPKGRDYDDIKEAVREMSAAFIEAGLGYHLEGRFRGGYPIVQAYNVEQVVFVKSNGAPRRVLSLRRLDKLNTSWAVLGMHDEDAGDPVLHLDRIDINVASFVLPVLAGGQPYPLADEEWMLWPQNKETANAIGDAVRKEYVAALDKDATNAQKAAALLVNRNSIIEEWRDKLGRKDIYFISTDELFVPESLLTSLEGRMPYVKKVRGIDAQLAALEAPRIHSRMHDLVAATVRRHEAQHGFDYDRDTELRYPQALQDWAGAATDFEGNPRAIASSARAELSAYLSQIINDPVTPQASMWNLGRQVFHRDRWSTGEFYAGMVVIEGLAKQFGGDITTPYRNAKRELDRDRLSVFAKLIAKQSGDQLRAAAKTLWTELYGEPPTTIIDAPPRPVIAQQ
jgi:hypothetical protein